MLQRLSSPLIERGDRLDKLGEQKYPSDNLFIAR